MSERDKGVVEKIYPPPKQKNWKDHGVWIGVGILTLTSLAVSLYRHLHKRDEWESANDTNMDTKDKIAVVQTDMAALRKEIDARIESQNTLWRTVIAGIAAVIILETNINIERFLPVVPILGMGLVAIQLSQTFLFIRAGRQMAAEESQINSLVGEELLHRESNLWQQRKAKLTRGGPIIYILLGIGITALHFWLIYRLLQGSSPPLISGFSVLLWVGAAIVNLIALISIARIWLQLRNP